MTIWDLYTLHDFVEKLIEELKYMPNFDVDVTGDELISISQRPCDVENFVKEVMDRLWNK